MKAILQLFLWMFTTTAGLGMVSNFSNALLFVGIILAVVGIAMLIRIVVVVKR